MSYSIKGKIEGLGPLLAKLDAISAKARKKVTRQAVNQGTKVLLPDAKARVPVVFALLKKSMGRKVKVFRNGVAVGMVGPRTHMGAYVLHGDTPFFANPSYYAHLVELGVQPHAMGEGSSNRKGIATGKMHPGFAGRHFMLKAFESSKARIIDSMLNVLRNGIEDAGGGK